MAAINLIKNKNKTFLGNSVIFPSGKIRFALGVLFFEAEKPG